MMERIKTQKHQWDFTNRGKVVIIQRQSKIQKTGQESMLTTTTTITSLSSLLVIGTIRIRRITRLTLTELFSKDGIVTEITAFSFETSALLKEESAGLCSV